MITMTWLCRSFSIALAITLLLAFLTADFTSGHSPKYNKKEVSRSRRSVSSSNENVSTTGSTVDNNQTNTYQATVSPRLSGSDKNTSDSNKTSDTSQSPHVEPHAPTTQPSPSVTNSTSQVFPSATSVHPNATQTSSVPGHTAVSVNTTGVSGDSKKRITSDRVPTTTNAFSTSAIGLHPRPKPEVTSTAVTTTTTSKSSPSPTPKKSDCPLQTAIPGHKQQGLVSNCLIAIASLAGLATFFMVCSIILCTKLSNVKHRYRYQLRSCSGEGTEMVCISSLLPDGEGMVVRPKTPKSNGALIPITDADGDSDYADNLTLNSFLQDGDRV